jgi:UDP-N-acetylmuramyl tripeptide synthase
MATEILPACTGNPYYNGSIVVNTGSKGKHPTSQYICDIAHPAPANSGLISTYDVTISDRMLDTNGIIDGGTV